MNKLYIYMAGTLLAVTSLTSCNKSQYVFKPTVSPYHESATRKQVTQAIGQASPVAAAETNASSAVAAASSPAEVTMPATKGKISHVKADIQKPISATQQVAAARIIKQLRKPLEQRNEISKIRRGMSSAGRAGIIIGIGAVILLIGGLIGGTNFVATIGGIVLLVGVVLLIIALINGK